MGWDNLLSVRGDLVIRSESFFDSVGVVVNVVVECVSLEEGSFGISSVEDVD